MLGSRQYWSLHQETLIVITNPQQLNGKSQQCALCDCILCLRMTLISDPSASASQDCRHVPPILFYMVLGSGPRAACMLDACSINRATLPALNSIHFSPLSLCLLELLIASTFLPFPCAYPNSFLDVLCSYPALVPFPQAACLRERLRENQTAAGTEAFLQFPPT